jgi:hypothetical protein
VRGWIVLAALAGCDRVLQLEAVHTVDDAGMVDSNVDGPPDAAPPAKLVQAMTGGGASLGSITVVLPATPASGNMLIAIGGAENGVQSVTGSAIWQLVVRSTVSPTEYVYVGRPSGGAAIALTGKAPGRMWLLVTEWSGIDPLNTVDAQTAGGAGSGSSGTFDLQMTTSSAPDLVVFAVAFYDTIGPLSGMWMTLPEATGDTVMQNSYFQFSETSGQIDVQARFQNDYDAALAAFRTKP